MGSYLDGIPLSGIIRIRDSMFSVANPYRLDQGDISFDAPDSVKEAMARAIADNRTHYLQTNGVPRLRELAAAKLRDRNGIADADAEHLLVTNGAIHGLYALFQALLEPGDEVLVPDPAWPPTAGTVLAARGTLVNCPVYESRGWRFDLDELESMITPRTRVLYVNSPHNPTGGMLTRADLERLAAIAQEHDLRIVSDEAYEDIVFDAPHTRSVSEKPEPAPSRPASPATSMISQERARSAPTKSPSWPLLGRALSIASFPGLYGRTIPVYTFSKSYAMTGLRLGYLAIRDDALRERTKKVLFFTASNVSSIVQYGGIGALEGSQACVEAFRTELEARRDLFYRGIEDAAGEVFSGAPPPGSFYAFLRISPTWGRDVASGENPSVSWRMVEYLIKHGRIGCVPGIDFGANGEGYVRFCFARERTELEGALASMSSLFGVRA